MRSDWWLQRQGLGLGKWGEGVKRYKLPVTKEIKMMRSTAWRVQLIILCHIGIKKTDLESSHHKEKMLSLCGDGC